MGTLCVVSRDKQWPANASLASIQIDLELVWSNLLPVSEMDWSKPWNTLLPDLLPSLFFHMGVQGSSILNLDAFVFFSVSCTSSEKQTTLNLCFPVDSLIKVMQCHASVLVLDSFRHPSAVVLLRTWSWRQWTPGTLRRYVSLLSPQLKDG